MKAQLIGGRADGRILDIPSEVDQINLHHRGELPPDLVNTVADLNPNLPPALEYTYWETRAGVRLYVLDSIRDK